MRFSSITFLFCFLIFFLITCKEEEPMVPVIEEPEEEIEEEAEEESEEVSVCANIPANRDWLEEQMEEDNLIATWIDRDSQYIVFFENQDSLLLEKECLSEFSVDSSNWTIDITYTDNTQQELTFLGKLLIEAVLNPSGFNPLAAKLGVFAPIKGKLSTRVIGKNGPDTDVQKSFELFSSIHEVPILGLYPDFANQIEISYAKENGSNRIKDTLILSTSALNLFLPEIEVIERKVNKMEAGFTLISYLGIWSPTTPFIIDHYGDIRWLLDFRTSNELNNLFYDVGIERLQNGNFYFGNTRKSKIYEVDILGYILNVWPLPPGYNFHHNVKEKPDGNFLLTANKEGNFHLNGKPTFDDYVIEMDRNTGALVHEWDFKQFLDEYRTALGNWTDGGEVDWLHLNSVVYDDSDNSIIVSGRSQGVAKVDYNNNLIWVLGAHEGWGQNRMGQEVGDFLLSAVDATGVPYPENVQLGYENHPDFEWNWYQHAAKILPNGNLSLFDNGEIRNFNTAQTRYSRAVEYEIDEINKTVRQVWQYGKERGAAAFSSIISDVDFHPNQNNILFSPGFEVYNGVGKRGAKVIEIDYQTKEVVFEVLLNNPTPNTIRLILHRAERLPLYPI